MLSCSLDDYLTLKGFKTGRLDGQTPVSSRHAMIAEYNEPNSDMFCFLLSTRAGGLGINLTTADTIIILDHDYNPHNDLQALCRAHRIGQKSNLFIYRLVTINSVEENIVSVAKGKLLLDHIVVESMNKTNAKEIENVLKIGIKKLFSEEGSQRVLYDDEAIDLLLDRTITEEPSTPKLSENGEEAEPDLVIFKEEVFSHARIWEDDAENSPDAWKDLLPTKSESPKKQFGKGMRVKARKSVLEVPLFRF